jgi:hypothetical protein
MGITAFRPGDHPARPGATHTEAALRRYFRILISAIAMKGHPNMFFLRRPSAQASYFSAQN